MNIIKWIKDLFFITPDSGFAVINYQGHNIVNDGCEAWKFYCASCKRGFKTKGATGAHKSLKHSTHNKTGLEAEDSENPGETL